MIVVPLALPATLLVGYAAFAAYAVWDREQPRALPNGYRVITVNGNWHAIGYPRETSAAAVGTVVPIGSASFGIGQIAIHGPWVVGTVVDFGDWPTPRAWFVFDTASEFGRVILTEAEWRSKLAEIGADPALQLADPLSFPHAR